MLLILSDIKIVLFFVKEMKTIAVNELCEIVSDPTTLGPKDQIVVQDADLPEVESELSVTLRLKLKSHTSDWASVFFKGRTSHVFYKSFDQRDCLLTHKIHI